MMLAKHLTLLIYCLVLGHLATAQTYSSVVKDKEIYSFLDWLTRSERKYGDEPKYRRKVISSRIISWDSSNFVQASGLPQETKFDRQYIYKDGVANIFSSADREFIVKQFIGCADSMWHRSFSKSTLWTKGKQKRPNKHSYSIPLFSIDRNHVVVYEVYYCGMLCAYGGYKVYEKNGENSWRLVTTVNSWIS